jgi:ATP-dependent Clp protease ATP-binding subunit ClpA
MFERYDEPARRVIFFARFEAGALGASEIDTEHLLLGLFRQDQPLLDRLVGAPVDVEAIRRKIRERTVAGEVMAMNVDMPLTIGAKRVLARVFDEAIWLEHEKIGTQHMLLGLLLEEDCAAAELLRKLGLSIEKVREDLTRSADRPPSEEAKLYDPAVRGLILFAHHEASVLGAAEINAEHMLLGLLSQDQGLLLRLAGVHFDVESVSPGIRESALVSDTPGKRVLARALDEANSLNHEKVGTEHLLLALLLEETSAAAAFLRGTGLSVETVREDLSKRADGE